MENFYKQFHSPGDISLTVKLAAFSLKENIRQNRLNKKIINPQALNDFNKYYPNNLLIFPTTKLAQWNLLENLSGFKKLGPLLP